MVYIVTWSDGRNCAIHSTEAETVGTVKELMADGIRSEEIVIYEAKEGFLPRISLR